MAQPQKYDRTHDFEGDDDLSKSALNTELDNVSISINGLRANLALIQNDDGSLKAGVVTIDSLAPDILDHMSGELKEAVESAATFANSASLSATASIQAKDDTYQLYLDTEALHDGVVKMNNQTSENATIVVNKTKEVVEFSTHVDSQKQAVDLLTERAETAATSASNDKTSVAEMKASVDKSEQNVTQLAQSASESQKAAALSEANAKNSEQTAVEAKEQAEDAANKALTQLHAVSYIPQSLTEEQKQQARNNIGAVSRYDKVNGAIVADSAITDAKGNVIDETYLTKTEFTTGLSGKANTSHSHEISNVNGLQTALNGKQAAGDYATNTALKNGLNGKANSSHSHSYLPLSGGTVSGNVTVTGALKGGSVQATSDKRLKENIEPIELCSLESLQAYRYTLKEDGKKHVGLIAQDVQKVLPEAVSEGEDGFLSMDYNAIVALLVDKVNALEKRINELEAK